MTEGLAIAAGLALLLVGGEVLLRGAVAIARRAGVSELLIGLTLVGFMTSLPELLVSVRAATTDQPGLALGNVVGSNIANLLLILGAGALVRPLATPRPTVLRDGGINLAAGLALALLALDGMFGRLDGALLVAGLGAYLAFSYRVEKHARRGTHVNEAKELESPRLALAAALSGTLAGLAALLLGADLLVDGAVGLARRAGVSEAMIGLSLVAVGTSLPELATSVIAAARRHTEVAVGNAVGSCIFNTLAIIGASSFVAPYAADAEVTGHDLPVMLTVSFALLILAWPQRMGRGAAVIALLAYGLYLGWLFSR